MMESSSSKLITGTNIYQSSYLHDEISPIGKTVSLVWKGL